jgi:hypothetical protein
LEPETAWFEYSQIAKSLGFKSILPASIICARVDLNSVADLTDPRIRRRLKIKVAQLHEPWSEDPPASFTQQLGRYAFDLGFDGLLVPSRKRGGRNLNLFPENMKKSGSTLNIINEDQLP